jgi:hypothetical protein
MMRESFQYPETLEKINLVVETLSPTKWLLIDKETGQMYQGNPGGYWDKLEIKKIDKK